MISDSDIALTFIVIFSMLAIAFYLQEVGLMTANIALIMFFGTLVFIIIWHWGIVEIRFRLMLRREHRGMHR